MTRRSQPAPKPETLTPAARASQMPKPQPGVVVVVPLNEVGVAYLKLHHLEAIGHRGDVVVYQQKGVQS